MRTQSYGQKYKLTAVDRFGVYLSERMVMKYFNSAKKSDSSLLDLGCGFQAQLLRKLAPRFSLTYGVDVAVSEDVKSLDGVKIYEQRIEDVFCNFADGFFDVVTMINLLEHLNEPQAALKECLRILKPEGLLLINVPTWRGKFFLETSAFVFKLSPESEVADHKMYFDKKDLWPLLVKAGFESSAMSMKYHKFGLNLFAACRKR